MHDHIDQTKFSIFFFDASTGKELWRYDFKGTVNNPPVLYNNMVYIRTDLPYGAEIKYHLAIYRTTSGEKKSFITLNIYCLEAQSGVKVWEYNSEGGIFKDPIYSDDKIYMDNFRNVPICLDAKTGVKIWY